MDKNKRWELAKQMKEADHISDQATAEQPKPKKQEKPDPDAWREERTSVTITKGMLWDLKHEAFEARKSLTVYLREILENRHNL